MLTWDDYEENDVPEPVVRSRGCDSKPLRSSDQRNGTAASGHGSADSGYAEDGAGAGTRRRRAHEPRESAGGRRCTRREGGVSRHRGLVRARHGRSETNDQLPRRPESAGAVQVRLGLAEVSRRLREPLDAARDQHDGRHRVVENRRRSVRRRAPDRQAQPRVLLDRRFAGGEQPRARDLSADHESGVSPIPAATGLRRSDPHARLSVRDPVARHGRRRDLQHVPRGAGGGAQGVVGAEVHARSVAIRRS